MTRQNNGSPGPPPAPAGGRGHRSWTDLGGDVSGAFADLGTFLPLVIGMFAVQRLDPAGVLIGFGVFALATAWLYRRPVPVQPMKVVAALVIAGGLGPHAIAATGLLLGLVLIVLAARGGVGWIGRLVPSTVMNGIQLGVGLYLAWAGAKLMVAEPIVAALALLALLLLQFSRFKPLAALGVVAGAGVYGAWGDAASLPALGLSWHLPEVSLPDGNAFWTASRDALLPQLALTLTNATVITAAIAAEYFPAERRRITPDRLAMSTGVINLILAPFGAFPMCHGAGGLVVQHRFGARTGLAPAIFGITCLSLGLLLGAQALALLALLPMAAVGALLLVAGLDLAVHRQIHRAQRDHLALIVATGISCVLVNVAFGLLVGLLLEWLRVRLGMDQAGP